MRYRVIRKFSDLKDNRYKYEVGDSYPRKGKRTSQKRVAELMSTENRRHAPVIEEVIENAD